MKKFTRFLMLLTASLFIISQCFAQNILAVDRDGSAWTTDFTDCWPYYQQALDANGYTFTYYEVVVGANDGPDLATMLEYDVIIWFTGEVWKDNETMTVNDETNLAGFLDAGGNLFLSAQDYLWDRYSSGFGSGDFPWDYLGLRTVVQDNWVIEIPDIGLVNGVVGSLAGDFAFEVQDIFTTSRDGLFIDEISDHVAEDLFELYDPTPPGICAIQYDAGGYKTVFTTASYASITDTDIQEDLMIAIIDYFTAVPGDCDYFDTYTAGEFLCPQSPLWTTWDDNPGGDYDGYVTDAESFSAPNSLSIDLAVIESDLIYNLDQKTEGRWEISLEIMVPTGGTYGGYYNVMQDMTLYGTANEWGFQVYFKSDGTGYMYDADFNQTDFTYTIGAWTSSIVIVDLDNDVAEFWLDGTKINEWQWDVAGPKQLGVIDIYAAADGSDDPKFYIDDVCFIELINTDCDYFDTYTAGELLCPQSDLWTTWDDNPGGDYDGYVTDAESFSPPNSLSIDLAVIESDLIYNLDQKTEGRWEISLELMVPTGDTYGGYYNIMQDMTLYGTANEWGFQVYFKSDGTGYMYDADFNQTDFTYTVGDWTSSIVIVDLDNDVAEFWLNDVKINDWQWDVAGPKQLGVIDIYAAADGSDLPKCYFDDVCFIELNPVGIDYFTKENANIICIFPNPVNNYMNITSSENMVAVKIFNTVGQIVYNSVAYGNSFQVNTQGYESGLYIVQIQTENGFETKKFMKQ